MNRPAVSEGGRMNRPATPEGGHVGESAYPVLAAENIRRRYGNRPPALDMTGSTFAVHAGEVVGIMGHNGCGKSTLMRILALLDTPDAGELRLDGTPIWSDTQPRPVDKIPHILALRRQITLLLQTPYLLSRSVVGNVAYGLTVRGVHDPARVRQALEAVGLDPAAFLHRRRNELSGGEAQRVALAARLAIAPRVLLMDEPTSGVDETSAGLMAHAVTNAAANGAAVVIVSHDAEWLSPLCHRIVRFRNGTMT